MSETFDDAWLSWASAQDADRGSGETTGHLNTGSESRNIWVLGLASGGFADPDWKQAVAAARELADELGTRVQVPVIGPDATRLSEELIPLGADTVLKVEVPGTDGFQPEVWTAVLGELVARHRPELILVSGCRLAEEVAPRLAIRARTGFIADAIALTLDDEARLVRVTRAVMGGKLITTSVIDARKPQIVALRPGAFREAPPDRNRRGQVISIEVGSPPSPGLVQGDRLPGQGPALDSARRLVVGGRGIADADTWLQLAHLARLLGAELGATRGAIEMGLADPSRLVGSGGHKVSPDLYIGVGVSGSADHLGAMAGARAIVAVNLDADSPLMAVADHPLVGDLRVLLPAWIQMLADRRA